MKIEDLPYLRELSIDFKHHIGGYMGGGSWAITSKTDANGARKRKYYLQRLTFISKFFKNPTKTPHIFWFVNII